MTTALLLTLCLTAVNWQHPAGMITDRTIAEVRAKTESQDWARKLYENRKSVLDRWVQATPEELRDVFPRKRGNVYHNFSCPDDRTRLEFDAFNPKEYRCETCGKSFSPDTDAGIYEPGDRYHGTMYDGWICLFHLGASAAAADLGLVGRLEADPAYTRRAVDLLLLYAEVLKPLVKDGESQYGRILTYHREGDNKILDNLATAYELVRDKMTPDERVRVETDVLRRLLEDEMLEPFYPYDHNNIYQWHATILQTALALEREDLIDWVFGYGAAEPERLPEHRSLRRIVATHFKPDGAFWELCSGYHLYPMYAFCNIAVLSHHLSQMDPERFPAERYDYSVPSTEGGRTINAALNWFLSMAMPDRTMPTIGDSTKPRAGMDDYDMTAEVGYRYFGIKAIGDYASLREGKRSWSGLLYGAPEIAQAPTPFTSSYLSSGWVSLRNEWQGNRVWVGLNGLIPGGGHQHADRLTFIHYSQGRLLTLEKTTPYNESVTRELGTLTPAHNTVVVDRTSQKQGEALEGTEIPRVSRFFNSPLLKFARIDADNLYEVTTRYRRSVALIEDLAIDVFEVQGGSTHDWMVNHAGVPLRLCLPTGEELTGEEVDFEPAEWLANGHPMAFRATVREPWTATWTVDDVTSRLTMFPGAEEEVFRLRTYPVDNAVETPESPLCPTLCVRQREARPFVALWDAWKESPNLQEVRHFVGDEGLQGLRLRTAANEYHILLGPGRVQMEGVTLESDAEFALLRNRDAAAFINGTRFAAETPQGRLTANREGPATVAAENRDGVLTLLVSGDIQYDTVGGRDLYRDAPDAKVRWDGDLWRVRETHLLREAAAQ